MIAYNRTKLDKRNIQEQAKEALGDTCITGEEYAKIRASYPDGFYTPNTYIRIGLFLLTFLIGSFCVGLLALIAKVADNGFGWLLVGVGLLSYGLLEYLVYSRRHFMSGIDDALLWMAATIILLGLYMAVGHFTLLRLCIALFLVTTVGALRFADRVMTLIAYGAWLGIIFKVADDLGTTGKLMIPFLILAVSVMMYFGFASLYRREKYRHYRSCLSILKAAGLISFYAAGNYFVVREIEVLVHWGPAQAGEGARLPLGWLFWTLTLCTPLYYIIHGLQKKEIIFLWAGLGLLTVSVFTVKHYYGFLPVEQAMTIAGFLLISLAYTCIKYLRIPRRGFTYQPLNSRYTESLHLESLVIAETMTPPAAPGANDFQFGGGSGGGGGAGGQY
jgi:hypothetical protein